jgi:site-specific recombinase XerD
MRVTINGGRFETSTQRYVEATKWSTSAGKMKGNTEEARSLNVYLDTLKNKVYFYQKEIIQAGEQVTAETFKQKWLGVTEKPRMLLEIFQQHNSQLEQLVGKEFAKSTLSKYSTALEHIKTFIKWKFNAADVDIKKLSYEFITDFEFWLKSVKNCNHNSAIKYIGNFRKIVNYCLKSGWLLKDPFFGFKMAKKEVVREFLTEEELGVMAGKTFAVDRLSQVRDIFLFCCFTGLAYVDVHKLRRSQIAKGVDGDQWIFTSRQKTDTPSRIPLLPAAKDIIEKYSTHPKCINEDRLLPVLSNQKMNAYLKEIADMCNIHKQLTFHIARHTFATTVTLSNGVPIESVSKMLGHRSIKITQHYAKILDVKVGADMGELKKKLAIQSETEVKQPIAADSVGFNFREGKVELLFSQEQITLIDEAILSGDSQSEATSPTGFWFQATRFWREGMTVKASKRELDIVIIKSLEPYLRCPVEQKRKLAATLFSQLYDILVDGPFEPSAC